MSCDAWIEIYLEGHAVMIGCALMDHEGDPDHYGEGIHWRDELRER